MQDNQIVKVTSPLDTSVTAGHLCIKGRFGFEFVQNDRGGIAAAGPSSTCCELVESDGERVQRPRGGRLTMPIDDPDPTYREASPIDARGRVPVAGADGWRYEPFEHDEAHNLHRITLVREEDGEEVVFTMPDFVEQGDELGEIALLVIRARERWRELKGVGG